MNRILKSEIESAEAEGRMGTPLSLHVYICQAHPLNISQTIHFQSAQYFEPQESCYLLQFFVTGYGSSVLLLYMLLLLVDKVPECMLDTHCTVLVQVKVTVTHRDLFDMGLTTCVSAMLKLNQTWDIYSSHVLKDSFLSHGQLFYIA